MHLQQIDIDLIELAPGAPVPVLQPELVDEIAEVGVLTPLVVRPEDGHGHYILLRHAEVWRAAQQAKVAVLPCSVVGDSVPVEPQAPGQDPISEARWLARLIERRGGRRRGAVSGLARQLGCRRATLSHKLRLLKLSQPVQDWVAAGKLSPGHGRALIRVGKADQERVARRILQGGWTVRESEDYVRGSTMSPNPEPDPDLVALTDRIGERLGARVNLVDGELRIAYHDDLEVLDGILQRLGIEAG